ncbi:LuxR C-terminal-related transcriptional regulator [Piscinibacter sakaiensis]|uniref:helix-turn-helix transcriptional regulator n=1 Tax=Piscinibacter sakaiensis TaxID=1547922 RepID=UPI003AAF070B
MTQNQSSAGPADDLLLKVTPPRAPRNLVARSRLTIDDARLRDAPVVLVQAPAGFGKTSLLAQWRLEHLAHGAVVAWVLAQAHDHPKRLVQALALAVRSGAARPGFGHTLLESPAASAIEGVTDWLAEVAQSAIDLVVFVDEVERLPEATLEVLTYLLHNAPPNLRVVLAARSDCTLALDDLIDYGHCVVVGQSMLRLQLAETLELVHKRYGSQFDDDAAARLHDLTEGWPLGLQLVLAAMADGGASPLASLAPMARDGALREHFIGLMLARLDPADGNFLTRIAIVDVLHPDLCRALIGTDDAVDRLAWLVRDTPVFVAVEGVEWLRMHSMARDVLRERFVLLPADEQAALHTRAADWLAARGLLELAAGHALDAGLNDRAYELAERSLYGSLMTRGQQSSVLEWLERLPPAELDRRPRLLLAAAWSLALSERHDEAGRLVERILAQPDVDATLQCECSQILSGAAVFADDPDRFAMLHDRWGDTPPLRDPLLLKIHANRSAFRLLLEGEPEQARLREHRELSGASPSTLAYVSRWGDLIVGLTYLWEGQVLLAERQLRPALAQAEAELGRRSRFATMLGALLASAVWERNQPADAAALMANRLDVLERSGLPETVLLGYRTMARMAAAQGAENRALELLGAMFAVGVSRRLPRLCIASLADQVRLHARRFRPETCRELCGRIDGLLADPAAPTGRLWRRSVSLLRELAFAYAAVAAQDWRKAIEPLEHADALAQQLKQGRVHIEMLGLRAFALDRCGERSAAGLLREAAGLAQAYGLLRVFDDAHPALGDWARQSLDPAVEAGPLAAPLRAPPPLAEPARPRAQPSMALTPKEREVLELLTRNLSNKEIALAMQVGEATIKWHMKNLFAKLDAGTRKQVVQRARILGLLESG